MSSGGGEDLDRLGGDVEADGLSLSSEAEEWMGEKFSNGMGSGNRDFTRSGLQEK